MAGYGPFLTLAVTLSGELDPRTGYLRNIKEIDDAVRRHVIPAVRADVLGQSTSPRPLTPFEQPVVALGLMQSLMPDATVDHVRLGLSPFLNITCRASEHPMVRLSQKFIGGPRRMGIQTGDAGTEARRAIQQRQKPGALVEEGHQPPGD